MIYVKEYIAENLAKKNTDLVKDCNDSLTAEIALGEEKTITEADVLAARQSIAFEAKTNALREVAKKLCTDKNLKTFDAVINDIMKVKIASEAQVKTAFGA